MMTPHEERANGLTFDCDTATGLTFPERQPSPHIQATLSD